MYHGMICKVLSKNLPKNHVYLQEAVRFCV